MSPLAALLLVGEAQAHRPGLSTLTLAPDHVAVVFARPELEGLAPLADLDAARLLLAEATLAKLRVEAGGEPCALGEIGLRVVENDGVELGATLSCTGSGPRSVTPGWLADFEPGHRVVVEADGGTLAVLDREHPTATWGPQEGSTAEVAGQFVKLGVEHIWTGYDHLAFLGALLLAATNLRQMLYIVTGFTLAHSVTLSLAATGVFTLPSAVVEPAIAASILFVGLENLFAPTARRRLATTFTLGLVHGFGFAGLLAEIGLPRGQLGVALLSFNLGVELGQAAVVALTLPLLLWLRRREEWLRWGARPLTVGIAGMGAYWLVERLFGGG